MMTRRNVSTILASATILAAVGTASAQNGDPVRWVNEDAGNWLEAANWDPAVPALGDLVVIDGGPAQLSGAGEAGGIILGEEAAGSLELLSGGNLTLDGGPGEVPYALQIGQQFAGSVTVNNAQLTHTFGAPGTGPAINVGSSNASGVLEIHGSSSEVVTFDHVAIGGEGVGEFTMSGGVLTLHPAPVEEGDDRRSDLHVGHSAGGDGTFNLQGGTVQAGQLRVGHEGQGTANISGGNVMLSSWLTAGEAETGTGTINISGGLVNAASEVRIGAQGEGELNIEGGQFTTGSRIRLGFSGGVGTLNQTGGEIGISNPIDFGGDGGHGTAILSGGTFQSSSSARVGEHDGAMGTLIIRDNAQVTFGSQMRIGADGVGEVFLEGGQLGVSSRTRLGYRETGIGTFTMTGGQLGMGSVLVVGEDGHGEFNLENGVVNSTSSARIADNEGSTGVMTISGGNFNISSQMRVADGGVGEFHVTGGNVGLGSLMRLGHSGGHGTYTQTGGTVTVASNLSMADSDEDGTAIGHVSGGELNVWESLRVGQAGTAELTVDGGQFNIGQSVEVGSNGTLHMGIAQNGSSNSAGTLTIDEDYSQESGGTLRMDISNDAIGVITVANTANLAGTLALDVTEDFVLQHGQTYQILEAQNIVGTFDEFIRPDVDGLMWSLNHESDHVWSQAFLAGDFTGEGSVGGEDLAILLDHWGQEVGPFDLIDLSGDGSVGGEDLAIFLDNWGMTAAEHSAATTIPEPGSLAVLGAAGLMLLRRRRS